MRRLPAGIDDHVRPHFAPVAVFVEQPHADRAVAVEKHLKHAHALVHFDAVLARIVEHHLVELAAPHLPGLRLLARLVVGEIERLGQLAVLVHELHAFLADEVAFLELRQHAEPLERPVSLGNQAIRRYGSAETARARIATTRTPCWARIVETDRPGRTAADDDHLRRRIGDVRDGHFLAEIRAQTSWRVEAWSSIIIGGCRILVQTSVSRSH